MDDNVDYDDDDVDHDDDDDDDDEEQTTGLGHDSAESDEEDGEESSEEGEEEEGRDDTSEAPPLRPALDDARRHCHDWWQMVVDMDDKERVRGLNNEAYWLPVYVSKNKKLRAFVDAVQKFKDKTLVKTKPSDEAGTIIYLKVHAWTTADEVINAFYATSLLEPLATALGMTPLTLIAKRPGYKGQLAVSPSAPLTLLHGAPTVTDRSETHTSPSLARDPNAETRDPHRRIAQDP